MLLPSPSTYDELYYEVIRMHTVFDNLYVLCKISLHLIKTNYFSKLLLVTKL